MESLFGEIGHNALMIKDKKRNKGNVKAQSARYLAKHRERLRPLRIAIWDRAARYRSLSHDREGSRHRPPTMQFDYRDCPRFSTTAAKGPRLSDSAWSRRTR